MSHDDQAGLQLVHQGQVRSELIAGTDADPDPADWSLDEMPGPAPPEHVRLGVSLAGAAGDPPVRSGQAPAATG